MMKSFKSVVSGLAAPIAAAFSINAIKGFVIAAGNAVDESNKLARVLGVSLESMQGIEHAASLTGANMESITKAMTRLAVETGKAGDVALLEFAERMDGIADSAERARIAVAMFGERRAIDVLQMLDGGSAGLRAAMAERASFGVVSEKDARAIERSNDAMTRLRTASNALWQQFAAALAPAVEAVAESMLYLNKNVETIRGAFDGIVTAVTVGAQGLTIAFAALEAFGQALVAVAMALPKFMGMVFGEDYEANRKGFMDAFAGFDLSIRTLKDLFSGKTGPIADLYAMRGKDGGAGRSGGAIPAELAAARVMTAQQISRGLLPVGQSANKPQRVVDEELRKIAKETKDAMLELVRLTGRPLDRAGYISAAVYAQ